MIRTLLLMAALTLSTSMGVNAQAKTSHQPCLHFVQSFYSWYGPLAAKERRGPPSWIIGIRQRSSEFSPSLIKMLDDDWSATRKAKELVGLDYDPFVNSQDPSPPYKTGKVTQTDKTCSVEILGTPPAMANRADVIAELEYVNGSWSFVNFHYPDGGDLISQLKLLRADREKH